MKHAGVEFTLRQRSEPETEDVIRSTGKQEAQEPKPPFIQGYLSVLIFVNGFKQNLKSKCMCTDKLPETTVSGFCARIMFRSGATGYLKTLNAEPPAIVNSYPSPRDHKYVRGGMRSATKSKGIKGNQRETSSDQILIILHITLCDTGFVGFYGKQ